MKVKIKGVNTVKKVLADGSIRVHYYHRASGKPLEGRPGTPLFLASIAGAEKAMRDRTGETFAGLIRLFENSGYFADLSEVTRKDYRWKLAQVEKRWGTCPVGVFSDPESAEEFARDVLAWHNELGRGSKRSADALVGTVTRLLSFAKKQRVIRLNPLPSFDRLYKADRSEMVWSDGLIARFMEVARPEMVTAMMIVRNIGLRQMDVRKLAWSAYDGETISLRPSKSRKHGTVINVPVSAELKSYLDRLARKGPLVLTTKTGRAYAKRRFNDHWREDADSAGAGALNFHDLRGTAATRLAEAGCPTSEIASILGWTEVSAQRVISRYVAKSSALAAAGIERLEEHRRKKKSGPSATPGTKAKS